MSGDMKMAPTIGGVLPAVGGESLRGEAEDAERSESEGLRL
jgi:hypothetical protein